MRLDSRCLPVEANLRLSRRSLVVGVAGAAGAIGAAREGAEAHVRHQQKEDGVLTDVPGFAVGHTTLIEPVTGCTAILCPPRTVGGVELRGGWTGTRDIDILSPLSTSPYVHALLLTGGSTYGLAAADGVMRWVEERLPKPAGELYPVPQAPSAVIYDLTNGNPLVRPGAEEGFLACENARQVFERGSVGAGTGATVGPVIPGYRRMKGGLGSASRRFGGSGVVGAIAVTNSLGNIVDRDGTVIAGAYDGAGRRGDVVACYQADSPARRDEPAVAGSNTTLVAVATNAALTKTQCAIVAKMAQAGLARAVQPVFTAYDGDVVFVLAAGDEAADVDVVGVIAAEVVADAIHDAVRQATSLGGVTARRDAGVGPASDPAWSAE